MRDNDKDRQEKPRKLLRKFLFLGFIGIAAWFVVRERAKTQRQTAEEEALFITPEEETKPVDEHAEALVEEIDVEMTFVDVVAAEEDLTEFALAKTNFVIEEDEEIGEDDEIDLALEEDIENGDIDEEEGDFGEEFGEFDDFEEVKVTLVEALEDELAEEPDVVVVEAIVEEIVEEELVEAALKEAALEEELEEEALAEEEDEELAQLAAEIAALEAAEAAELEAQETEATPDIAAVDETTETVESQREQEPARWVHPIKGECPDGFPVKARFSTGRFHAPGDRGYEKVVPDCCYPTVEDAEADGFTHSRWS